MAVGVPVISRLSRHFKAQQCDDGGAGIRQVVDRIGHDRDGACHKTQQKFSQKQQQIAGNAHTAA